MADCSQHKNPLRRSGTSQQQRLLNGLRSDYVQVDEKEFSDWIVFANEFSSYLNYYDNTNTVAGDWRPFFSRDISAVLGTIAIQDAEQYKLLVADKLKALQSADPSSDIPALKKQLGDLFNIVLSFSFSLERILFSIPKDILLTTVIESIVKSRLQPALHRLLSYYKGGKSYSLITEQVSAGTRILNQDMRTAASVVAEGLTKPWWSPKTPAWTNWKDYYDNGVPEEKSIYGIETDDHRRLAHLANHNLFKTVLNEYLSAFSKIVSEAERQLMQTLESWPTHPAHYTLFLAFLKLFRQSRSHINTLTQRHLDFYYKEVLQLRNKPQEPNHAHIVVELAKQTQSYLLEKGTLFRAGKDSLGKDVFYALDRNVVFNKAAVAKLMNVYKSGTGKLFASPVIESGQHPFVNTVNQATAGFAVASHYLFLAEGERRVTLKLGTTLSPTPDLECYLTTPKGWLKVSGPAWGTGSLSDLSPCTTLTFTLEGDAPAITAFNAAVHGGNFNVNVPVMKLYFTHSNNYDTYANIAVSKVEVAVEVGLNTDGTTPNGKGLKQLSVLSDTGVIDASKPFQPFGALPIYNASMIVGSKELFSKKGASYKLRVEWGNITMSVWDMDYDPTFPNHGGVYPSAKMRYLQKGNWTDAGSTEIFSNTDAAVNFPASMSAVPDSAVVQYNEEYKPFDNTSTGGYLKLSLTSDFGHRSYQTALTNYLIAKANGTAGSMSQPIEPYTPLVQSLSVSYKAVASSVNFFHLYPFGEVELQAPTTLLPQFVHSDSESGTIIKHQGEFYIGLTGVGPQESVSMLLQVLDGSTDPLVEKPADHVHWSYLGNNQWKPFEKFEIADATNHLVQSGIVSVVIPADATTNNTMLPAGHIWIRAAIEKNPGAVCKLLAVVAQAAQVTWKPLQNAPDFLSKALPANTISKLKDPVAAIKKVLQPYPSFGGRSTETDAHFYLRVSERLRHRARPITIWDYERLVLEAFPQIHKVKCLNHTQIDEGIYNEVQPGYVSVITIPVLSERNDADPLKPYTNKNLLMEIESYLSKKTSCHVKVRVRNPQFEQVRLKFKLKLLPGYADFTYYSNQLKEEITRFLTPWAFNSGLDIEFGGKMHKSVLINFIEERSYVDYITNVEMFQKTSEASPESGDLDVIEASTARSILVSVPAANHEIEEITISETVQPEVCAV